MEGSESAASALGTVGFAAFHQRGDRAADLAVRAVTSGGLRIDEVSELLERLLRWMPDLGEAPPEVREFLEAPPTWSRLEGPSDVLAGQRSFQSRRLQSFLVLGLAGLPVCYAVPTIAETLMVSGRLAVQVDLRLRETSGFVAAVMEPGALGEGGRGLVWCRKVRLVHACMRLLARTTPPAEDSPSFGDLADVLLADDPKQRDRHPIDQVELALVLQTFAQLVLQCWRKVGAGADRAEREAYLAAWNAVGHEIGIEDEMLPLSDGGGSRPAAAWFDRLLQEEAAPDQNGRLLTATLLVSIRKAIRRGVPSLTDLQKSTRADREFSLLRAVPGFLLRWFDEMFERMLPSLPRTWLRDFLGRPLARRLDVGRAPLLHWLAHRVVILGFAWFGPALIARSLGGGDAAGGRLASFASRAVPGSAFDPAAPRPPRPRR